MIYDVHILCVVESIIYIVAEERHRIHWEDNYYICLCLWREIMLCEHEYWWGECFTVIIPIGVPADVLAVRRTCFFFGWNSNCQIHELLRKKHLFCCHDKLNATRNLGDGLDLGTLQGFTGFVKGSARGWISDVLSSGFLVQAFALHLNVLFVGQTMHHKVFNLDKMT